jgi:hypothetical protein
MENEKERFDGVFKKLGLIKNPNDERFYRYEGVFERDWRSGSDALIDLYRDLDKEERIPEKVKEFVEKETYRICFMNDSTYNHLTDYGFVEEGLPYIVLTNFKTGYHGGWRQGYKEIEKPRITFDKKGNILKKEFLKTKDLTY